MNTINNAINPNTDTATFAAGCFWCVEAVFQQLEGVISIESGYTGGNKPNPTYSQVCNEETGHAEACRITFNPNKITYQDLLEVFWASHDPTTLNRQGADIGSQYRSAIFYHNQEQKEIAENFKEKLNKEVFNNEIVTEISPITAFYSSEDYHKDYFKNHPNESYCSFIIRPKIEKIKKVFKEKLK